MSKLAKALYRYPMLFVVTATVVVMLGYVTILRVAHYQTVVVSGESMEPTLYDGERLRVVILQNGESPPAGYPIVWAKYQHDHDVIKRLVGYPGDTVELVNGDTYVNGVLLMQRCTESYDNLMFELSDGEYLLLGDNRANSNDGRYWVPSAISREDLIGYVPGSELRCYNAE